MTLWMCLSRWMFCGVYLAVPGFTSGYLAPCVAMACALDLWLMRNRPHPTEINPHDLSSLKETLR